VRVLGDLDLFSSPDLQAVLGPLADARRPTVLNLSGTRFIDCGGLSVVLRAAHISRAGEWSFTLAPTRSRSVSRLIALANLDAVLTH
jgi:anti-anti-sigma factor